MKNKKLVIISVISVILIGCLSFGLISAYFTDKDTKQNQVTVGYNTIQVVEDFDSPSELVPGLSFKKDVKVENTGKVPCYVRVKSLFTDEDMLPYCTVDYNTNDWVYNDKDDYWYYTHKVVINDMTQSLFTTVKINDDVQSSDIKDFDILIYAESHQSDGYDTYKDVWGEWND